MLNYVFGNLQSVLYGLGAIALAVVAAAVTAVLYQYFTFNSCPPGTRPLPSPKGRIPIVGHRHLVNQVDTFQLPLICREVFVIRLSDGLESSGRSISCRWAIFATSSSLRMSPSRLLLISFPLSELGSHGPSFGSNIIS